MAEGATAEPPRQQIRDRLAEEERQDESGEVTSTPVEQVRGATETAKAAAAADAAPALAGEIGPLAGLLSLRPALGLFAYDAVQQHAHTHGPGAYAEHCRLHPRLRSFSYGVDAVFRVTATVLVVSGGGAIVWKIVFGHF